MAVPFAYDALRFVGALYLLVLAWQAVKPGGRSPFQVRQLPRHSNRKLLTMGFFTNVLNPKIAVMYLSLLPQFIDASQGHVLAQSLTLGWADTGSDQPERQRRHRHDRRHHRCFPRREAGVAGHLSAG